uniref:Atypical chemokine receptor 1 n=1 Tax=Pogona vitticeps TaxID=103695 RepID=A0A6J0UMB6_9SAUR
MGNCSPTSHSQSNTLDSIDLEELMANFTLNYTYDDDYPYDNSLVQPCHSTYCMQFGVSIPPFLAVASILGLICNLILDVALVRCPRLWDQPHPSRTKLVLISAAGTLFASTLPFFAVASSRGWIFGDPFCQVAQGLKYGCLFAQSLMMASTLCHVQRGFANKIVLVLFLMGFVCAIPAAMSSSSTENICVPSQNLKLLSWSLGHTSVSLALFDIFPVMAILARVAQKWRGKNQWPQMDITWLFPLFWAPYGVAQLLHILLQEKVLVATCPFQKHLDYFLGISEGLGTVHCFLCPLLILGFSFCPRKSVPALHSG